MTTTARLERRDRHRLLYDLIAQLPQLKGAQRAQTERAILRLEVELASGRGAADQAQRRLDLEGAAQ